MVVRLILSGHGYKIGKKGGMIVIHRSDGGKKEISVGNLSTIIVNARGVSLSGDAINLLLKHGVQVVFLSRDRPVGKLQPMKLRFPVALKKEQVKAQLDGRGIELAKIIVLNKVGNQMRLLKRLYKSRMRTGSEVVSELSKSIEDIRKLYVEIMSVDDLSRSWLMAKEAETARHYWKSISSILPENLEFDGRKTRYDNPDDPFNLSLNYLYSLLMTQVWFSVELSGLDPFIGYLHEDNNRRPSLVMDLMEEFRQPVVDKPLIAYFTRHKVDVDNVVSEEKRLTDDFRRTLLKIFFEELDRRATFLNRNIPIKGHIHLQPKRLAKYLLGFSPTYQPYNVI
ncbi:CRISPR-associated endonuclease Cas1 [Candidatus Bathyarchaeota archaeon]|nr:CRISPR-associated endonuclease Cas1 [Candidatus Bathyarchaeota archaeon]